jgi:hypothetical protein
MQEVLEANGIEDELGNALSAGCYAAEITTPGKIS